MRRMYFVTGMHKMKCQMTAYCETSMQFDRVRILSFLFCESSATRAAAASGGRLVGGGGVGHVPFQETHSH